MLLLRFACGIIMSVNQYFLWTNLSYSWSISASTFLYPLHLILTQQALAYLASRFCCLCYVFFLRINHQIAHDLMSEWQHEENTSVMSILIHTYIHVCIEIEGDCMHIEYFDRVKAFHTIFSRSSFQTRSLVIHQVWGCCLNGKSDFTNSCPSPVVCSLGTSSFQKTVLWTDIQHIAYTHVQ